MTRQGFINGRWRSENIRLLYNIIHYTEKRNIPGLLLIDFEKAFDSVSWPFIKETFSFGPDIRKWIDIIYKNTKPCVVINGQVSTWFQIERGCRQGATGLRQCFATLAPLQHWSIHQYCYWTLIDAANRFSWPMQHIRLLLFVFLWLIVASRWSSETSVVPRWKKSDGEEYPRAKLVHLFLGAQELSRSCYLLILATPTRNSKGAPLCRYTGVARKVPFKLRPKDRKKVSDWYWKCVMPRGETKTEETEE